MVMGFEIHSVSLQIILIKIKVDQMQVGTRGGGDDIPQPKM